MASKRGRPWGPSQLVSAGLKSWGEGIGEFLFGMRMDRQYRRAAGELVCRRRGLLPRPPNPVDIRKIWWTKSDA
ncbi:hypothetical protein RHECNPAF_750015 [Rhizobium etli CNPAF512]|nr:hypothetical protein RHECNPAF_750015 [Rhizobium etli CNPAF512]